MVIERTRNENLISGSIGSGYSDSTTEDAFWGSDSSSASESTTESDDSDGWGFGWGNKRSAPGSICNDYF